MDDNQLDDIETKVSILVYGFCSLIIVAVCAWLWVMEAAK